MKMKKMTKLMLVLMAVLLLAGCCFPGGIAEDFSIDAETTAAAEGQATAEETAAEAADQAASEFTEESADAPAEASDETPETVPAEKPADKPDEEPVETPVEEPAEEPAEASAEEPAGESEEEPGTEPVIVPPMEENTEFSAKLHIDIKGKADNTIYFGTKVTIQGVVEYANDHYRMIWQSRSIETFTPHELSSDELTEWITLGYIDDDAHIDWKEAGWQNVKEGDSLTVNVNTVSNSLEYRLIVLGENLPGRLASSVYHLDAKTRPEAPAGESADEPAEDSAEEKSKGSVEIPTAEPAEVLVEEPEEIELFEDDIDIRAEEPGEEEHIEKEPTEEETAEDESAKEEIFKEEAAEESFDEELSDAETDAEIEIQERDTAELKPVLLTVVSVSIQPEADDEQDDIQIVEYEIPQNMDPITAIAETDADVRLDADGMSPIFTTLPAGTEIQILQNVGDDWVMVLADGQIGYIYIGCLENPTEEASENPEEPADTDEPEEEKPESDVPADTEKKVLIFTSRRTVMSLGETVYLTSILEGFENCEQIEYQWECDRGEGFEAVEDATSDSWSFIADKETLAWNWRLSVSYR